MLKEALLHIPKSNYAFALSENELVVRLRTAKNDCDKVFLFYGVKFGWNKKKAEMQKVFTDSMFDYYEFVVKTSDTRICYYFEIHSGGKALFYYEFGIYEYEETDEMEKSFQYPFINKADVHTIPSWVYDRVFYQIFPDRFYNFGNHDNSLSKWGELPSAKSFYGGNLEGIYEKLDYLSGLGVNGIYMTPIFVSKSNHKYDTTDYYEIDTHFGNKETFKKLVEKAHSLGIKIVLDAVFNHCGKEFFAFQDVLKNGENSQYKDWFFIESFPVQASPLNYKTFAHTEKMPKLNTENPEVVDYLLDVSTYWIKEFDIDGWRLDVSDEVDHKFWRKFREAVKAVKPDVLIIGENWYNSFEWLKGDQFDSVMNYSITKAAKAYFAERSISAKQFKEKVSYVLTTNTTQVNHALLNLLDSHDTQRFLTRCGGDKAMLKNAAVFMFTYVGVPCTYYGTEIGTEGGDDPDCRRTFDWNEENWDKELFAFYKRLIEIRKSEKALTHGKIEVGFQGDVFVQKRWFEEQEVFTLINNTDVECAADVGVKAVCLFTGNTVEGEVIVLPKSFLVLKKV